MECGLPIARPLIGAWARRGCFTKACESFQALPPGLHHFQMPKRKLVNCCMTAWGRMPLLECLVKSLQD